MSKKTDRVISAEDTPELVINKSVAIESSIDDIQAIIKRLDQRHGEDAVKTVLDGINGWWDLDVVGNRRRDEEMSNRVGN